MSLNVISNDFRYCSKILVSVRNLNFSRGACGDVLGFNDDERKRRQPQKVEAAVFLFFIFGRACAPRMSLILFLLLLLHIESG